jgi:ferritin-like protein
MNETTTIHEPTNVLSTETLDFHRAYRSLMEELEAVDWYAQRIDATDQDSLAAILEHNRDEEKEHAAMVLEWLRRHDRTWNDKLRQYLFTAGPIEALEDEAPNQPGLSSDLGIGDLRSQSVRGA